MTEKKVVVPIVYNDLAPAKNDSKFIDMPSEQIRGDDPRLLQFWTDAAKVAMDGDWCGYYDRIAAKLGGPSRADLGIGNKGYSYYLPKKSKKGAERTSQKVEFRGTASVFGQTIDLVWKTTLTTSGTREDINDVLTYLHGMPASEVIAKKLSAERDKAVKRLVAAEATPALA